jgi:hypothetical protein
VLGCSEGWLDRRRRRGEGWRYGRTPTRQQLRWLGNDEGDDVLAGADEEPELCLMGRRDAA